MNILTALGAYALISLVVAAAVGLISRDVIQTVLYFLFWPFVLTVLGIMVVVAMSVKHGARHDI